MLKCPMGREEGALRDRAACLSDSGEGGIGQAFRLERAHVSADAHT